MKLPKQKEISTIVDVWLGPDQAYMMAYKLAKDPARGIQNLLNCGNIRYGSIIELGNIFWGMKTGVNVIIFS